MRKLITYRMTYTKLSADKYIRILISAYTHTDECVYIYI